MELEKIIQENQAYLYRYAMYLSAHPDIAKDLVQQTWLQVMKHQDQLVNVTYLHAYLKKICINEYRMMMRKERPMESIEELEADGIYFHEEEIDGVMEVSVSKEIENLRNGCFLSMVRKLTILQRMAFSLSDMFGCTIEETALLMDISESAVKGLRYRARMNLSSFFANHCMFMKEENPCHCQAWIDFAQKRSKLQHQLKMTFSAQEFREKDHSYQKDIHEKLLAYYRQMPVQYPEDSWYTNLIDFVKNK
ncbi:RNA polymerase sigma factor [Absiella sp. AM29-15]|jgi:RNA polymerase sigma factor (sigma-70 family)|uniref:RNA polymerase sigma factor n=1 Tax=Absiella sp. AM29-15 TaxID=2292278 RepID=UPI000E42BCB2|nr:RNA polymerase sigma factor [Absiella sp. AM29-15]RGC50628.1 RNA polymerase sigma factor [Absiella sp. AM29-15]